MIMTRDAVTGTVDREIVFTRRLDAPRELVFRVWTQAEHVARWWGPRGFTTTTHEMEVAPGGVWRFVDYDNTITYREIAPPERLVYDHGERGAPGSFRVTVTFEAQNGTTRLTMRMLFESVTERDFVVEKYDAIEGGNQTLDRLTEYREERR
jgi:uncharacterized protein YndB with AHSA1/START domain